MMHEILASGECLLHFYDDHRGRRTVVITPPRSVQTPDWSALKDVLVTVTTDQCPRGIEYNIVEIRPFDDRPYVRFTLEPRTSWDKQADKKYLNGEIKKSNTRAFMMHLPEETLVLSRCETGYHRLESRNENAAEA